MNEKHDTSLARTFQPVRELLQEFREDALLVAVLDLIVFLLIGGFQIYKYGWDSAYHDLYYIAGFMVGAPIIVGVLMCLIALGGGAWAELWRKPEQT